MSGVLGAGQEYVDHLHEHFTDPCIVSNAAYCLPSRPGYSTQMYQASIARFRFPAGTYWAGRAETATPSLVPVGAAGSAERP